MKDISELLSLLCFLFPLFFSLLCTSPSLLQIEKAHHYISLLNLIKRESFNVFCLLSSGATFNFTIQFLCTIVEYYRDREEEASPQSGKTR